MAIKKDVSHFALAHRVYHNLCFQSRGIFSNVIATSAMTFDKKGKIIMQYTTPGFTPGQDYGEFMRENAKIYMRKGDQDGLTQLYTLLWPEGRDFEGFTIESCRELADGRLEGEKLGARAVLFELLRGEVEVDGEAAVFEGLTQWRSSRLMELGQHLHFAVAAAENCVPPLASGFALADQTPAYRHAEIMRHLGLSHGFLQRNPRFLGDDTREIFNAIIDRTEAHRPTAQGQKVGESYDRLKL